MKVVCDVHIARKVVRFFIEKGVESIHVNDILDGFNSKDGDITRFADENGFVVMSKDEDFKNSHLIKTSPKQLLKVNLGNIATKELIQILEDNFEKIEEAFENPFCLVEIEKDHILIYIT